MVLKRGKTEVTFVYRPTGSCSAVQVAGTFNNWQPKDGKMSRQKDGTYRKRLSLEPGRYLYRFVVDGQWTEDLEAEEQVINQFGGRDSVVTVG